MSKKFDFNINTLRVVAIIMVILLHSNAMLLGSVSENSESLITSILVITISVITRIAVPIFVLISGRYVLMSLEKTTTKDFYFKRVPRLLIPMIFWSAVFFIICLIGMPETTVTSYLKDFATGFAYNMAAIHIWYLFMLLGLYLVSPLIYRFIKGMNCKKLIMLGIVLTLLGFGVEIVKNVTKINVWIFWWMEFVGLFIMGYAMRGIKLKEKKRLIMVSAIIIELISSVLCCVLFSLGNSLGMVFFWGLTPTTTATAILVYMYFNSIEMNENIMASQSKYVLGIYLFHPIILVLMMNVSTGITLLDGIGKTVIAFFVSLVVMKLLYKIKIMRKVIS